MPDTYKLDKLVLSYSELWLNRLDDFIIRLNEKQYYITGGNNGPHKALESPVRNTAHVLVALRCIQDAGIIINEETALALERWLLSCHHFKNGAYLARQSASDHVNGVIGPAWVIQGLSSSHSSINYKSLHERAQLIASKLTFNNRSKLWERFDPFTKKYTIDYTLDHQIWLAACLQSSNFINNVDLFMDGLFNNRKKYIRDNGRFHHIANDNSFKNLILKHRYELSGERVTTVENGYHMYNLFALALLFRSYPNHGFFRTQEFQNSIYYVENNYELILNSTYGASYNNPGLALPLIFKSFYRFFSISESDVINLIEKSLNSSDGRDPTLTSWGKFDPVTAFSRYYELFLSLSVNKTNK